MAVLFENTANSLSASDGADFTAANSGDAGNGDAMAVTVGTGGTIKYNSANARSGFGIRLTIGAPSPTATWVGKTNLAARTAETWFRFYLKKEFTTPAGTWFDLFRVVASDGSSRCAVLRLTSSDVISGRDAADAATADGSGTPVGTGLVRFEVRVLPGVAGAGQFEWWMFNTNPQESNFANADDHGVNNAATLAASTAGFRAGVIATPLNMTGQAFTYDDLVIADSGPIGPASDPPPADDTTKAAPAGWFDDELVPNMWF